MEKGDLSDTEEVIHDVVENVPAVKPKKKLNLTPEARAKRAENMRKVSLARIEKTRSLNEIIKKDVDEVKHDVKLKAYKEVKKRVGKIKAEKLNEPEIDSDSDSDDSDYKPSKKGKKKSKQPINIIVKNYGVPRERKNEFDASEQIAKLKDIYRDPEPVVEQPKITLGYFV
jgi:hypothetical protein